MDRNLSSDNYGKTEEHTRQLLIQSLKTARTKLTPIIDEVIISAVDKIKQGENKFISAYSLTPEQYNDIIWATQIFQDIEYELRAKNRKYILPNSRVIVNNVSVSKIMSVKDNSIIIDEATVLELLQLYDNMGVVIHRMVNEGAKVSGAPSSRTTQIETSRTSCGRSCGNVATEFHKKPAVSTSHDDTDRDKSPKTKSTLSTLLDKFNCKTAESTVIEPASPNGTSKKHITYQEEPTIYIKIQCFSDWSDDDGTKNGKLIKGAKNCPSRYHVKLDGDPVMLKVNQNAENGAVYCINTGQDEEDSDIKIVIKQCPECKSTVIGSSTKIKDPILGESHESVTLHGKQGDEDKMSFSSDEAVRSVKQEDERSLVKQPLQKQDEDNKSSSSEEGSCCCCCRDTGTICISISRVGYDDGSPCSCDKSSSRGKTDTSDSQPKMDVVIDTDSVDKSTVKVRDTTTDDERESSSPSDVKIKGTQPSPSIIPLTRRRICSSMEFDVTTEPTKLRDHEIHHANARIVLELKELGVDNLLRACKPAKCCRKAILNERQRTALPYCVSLNSLPLVDGDIQVIKQSIDMSVKKIKNSMDLTQAQKDKLAFYVGLGRDDFRPNINFPWVVPVFDMNVDPSGANAERFFVLKKMTTVPKQVASVAKLTRFLNRDFEKHQKCLASKRCFVLTKSSGIVASDESRIKVTKSKIHKQRRKNEHKKVRFSLKNDNDPSYYMKMLKCNQDGSLYKRKNIWTNIGHDHWHFTYSQKHEQLNFNCADFDFGQKRKSEVGPTVRKHKHCKTHKKGSKHVGLKTQKTSSSKKCLDSGDWSCSLSKIFDEYLHQVNTDEKKLTEAISKEKSLVNSKSMPNFWNHISEELFYSSRALTVFVRRTRSLEKVNAGEIMTITQLEERWKFFEPQIERQPSQKKLEYYVGLVDGDLVWSNVLPLDRQNYNTYYNYSNHSSAHQSRNGAEEPPMTATRVTREEASRMRSIGPREGPGSQSSTISDLNSLWNTGRSTSGRNPDFPPEFASFSMEPENEDEPWAPHVVSDISLPRLKEQPRKVAKMTTEPEKEKTAAEPEKEKCSKSKSCARDITIAIKKGKGGKIQVEGTAPKPCHKEICELYKNKKMVLDKAKDDGEQHFSFCAKDNIEIYINNQKIKVSKGDKKSKSKTKYECENKGTCKSKEKCDKKKCKKEE